MHVCEAYLLASWLFIHQVQAQFKLFPNSTHSTANLSQGCITVLNATINCDSYIQQLVLNDYYGSLSNVTLQDSVCSAACSMSLGSYHNGAVTACASNPQPWPGVPAVWAGNAIWALYNRTCLKDPTTEAYGVNQVMAINTGNVAIQATCSTGPLPTVAQPPATNMTAVPGVVISNPVNAACLSGSHYTVQPGDDVQKIAVAHNVATGTLKTLNGIFPDSTNLFAGQDLCLPRMCPTYLVQANNNCATVAATDSITFAQLVNYNPLINLDCTNLISNTNICIGPSGPMYTPTTIPGAMVMTSDFATSTVALPGATPFGTMANCGKFYEVNPGDNCQQISLNNSISVDLFKETNPLINADCTNLTPGLFYCIWPLTNWNATNNATTTLTIATPPALTPTGSTSNCFEWHVVVSGDTCLLITTSFGITLAQFQTWNLQINAQCSNLLLGNAYISSALKTIATVSMPLPQAPLVPHPQPPQLGQ
ncbi:hypothetical protein BDQ12DRAFT_670041 [Crucibulum laeve]|uniref:LysM domain-containing protein n=1 Tax=Crucibulum laeve TaxID=68775 RepID=A0A5C3LLI9_9AGAR|nr:hypothetical protein BDQ12DRAFT_670041 [Crucibulum laeve]